MANDREIPESKSSPPTPGKDESSHGPRARQLIEESKRGLGGYPTPERARAAGERLRRQPS